MTNEEFNEIFRKRTFEFAVRVLKFLDTLPITPTTRVIIYQLTKSATSEGANYRAYCRGRSTNERFAKICIVTEEADETLYWLEVCRNCNYGDHTELKYLYTEGDEILRVVASIRNKMYQSR